MEGNIKRFRGSKMMQRWRAPVLLYAENGFKPRSIGDIVGLITTNFDPPFRLGEQFDFLGRIYMYFYLGMKLAR